MSRVNFSPEPFQGRQPRVVALWIANLVALALLMWGVFYWQDLRAQNRSAHQQIEAMEGQAEELAMDYQRQVNQLMDMDVRAYRQEVAQFHDIQTAYQTHWGGLLDQLGQLMPEDVRLVRVAPARNTNRDDTRRVMSVTAEARIKEAQLAFIRALQDQAQFSDIRLENESYDRNGIAVRFDLRFIHQPGGRP